MRISLLLYRSLPLFSFSLLLTACGGGVGAGSSPGPTPGGPSSQQLGEASSAQLRSTFDPATNRVTLQWQVNVTGASRYQIEQQDPSGEWVVIDGVWAPVNGAQLNGQRQYPQWTGVVNGVTTYRVEAVVPGGTVPLGLAGAQVGTPTSTAVSAPTPLPSITLDQPEPLETPVKISVVGDGTYDGVTISIDTPPPSSSFYSSYAPPWTTSVDPASYTTGTHLIYARVDLNAASAVVISRSVTIHTSKAALQLINILQTPDSLNINLVATSDSDIASVVGIVDGVALDTVTAPNSCVPLPCAAGQPFNAYHLSIDTKGLSPSYHFLTLQATDAAGNTAYASPQGSSLYIPAPANATLDFPLEGAVVVGTLHVSGSFSSGTPGPLEVMVTLSGVPVYDTTVANTGVSFPYSADVSLAGVAPGYHTLNTYARVGDTNYTQTASASIQVTKP